MSATSASAFANRPHRSPLNAARLAVSITISLSTAAAVLYCIHSVPGGIQSEEPLRFVMGANLDLEFAPADSAVGIESPFTLRIREQTF